MQAVGKILIVDDERLVREVCHRILTRHHADVVLCENGLEALKLYREMHSELALILCDVSMPVMDGPTFVRKVFEHNPKSNVILMTGYNPTEVTPGDLKRLCSSVWKPFSSVQLMDAVKKCLKYQIDSHPDEPSATLA